MLLGLVLHAGLSFTPFPWRTEPISRGSIPPSG